MSQVCRTCLEVVQNASQLFSLEINEPTLDTVHIKTKLETCVPEIALDRVKNSVICIYCVGALNTAYNFKTKCLQTEARLFECMTKETIDSADLKKFVEGNTKSPANHTPLVTTEIDTISLLNENGSNQSQPNEIHMCPICQKSLASNSLLKEHMSCHVEGAFKCTFCDFQSPLELELQEHLKSHNGLGTEAPQNEPPYKCASCDFITMDKTLFREHKVLHSGEKLHPCSLCNFKTTHSSSLRRHMKIHTGMRPFRCTKCRFGAPDMAALKLHMRVHMEDKPHKCSECAYSASKRIHLKNHMARAHADKVLNPFSSANGHVEPDGLPHAAPADPYQVSIDDISNILQGDCDLSNELPEIIDDSDMQDEDPYIVTVADIQEILQGKLPPAGLNEADGNEAVVQNEDVVGPVVVNQTVFRCPVCQQPFKFKYLLKKHMSVHARENKPYECSKCGYTTSTKSHFQVHMNTHTGGKVYSCEQCPYSTIYWSNMQKHSRVHTGEKPFKCPYCDYKATQQTSVNSHMNIHPEHRPYVCNECPYAADTVLALQEHMEMHAIGNHFMEEDDVILVPDEVTA